MEVEETCTDRMRGKEEQRTEGRDLHWRMEVEDASAENKGRKEEKRT